MAPPKPERLPNVDRRAQQSEGAIVAKHQQTIAKLKQQVPGVSLQFDPITGAPSHIMAPGRFLAAPNPDSLDVYEPVIGFVNQHRALFGHDATALNAGKSRITREEVTPHNGMRTVVWQQELDGVPLFQTILKASLTKNGDLISIGSHFIADPAAASGKTAAQRAALIAQPPISSATALSKAAASVGDTVSAEQVATMGAVAGAEKNQKLSVPGLSDTQASLTWVPMSEKELRLGWDVVLMSTRLGEMFRIVVDAQTGEALIRQSLTNYISDATYRVFARAGSKQPYDSPTPFSPGHSSPSSIQPPGVTRELVTIDALDTTASPNGWIDDGGTQTLGNNVDAHTDTDANNSPDLPRPTSATRTFDFTMDLATQAPSSYKNASVTHLFYLCNWIHDRFYELGFTESAGNFQTNNFGRGGAGNDAVQADAQDGSGTNNANFSTPPDGSAGRMQMYIFTGPTPDIDGDLDAEIVIHEYTHGLSNRLVGGGVGMSANQSQGMGEGWSDFFALSLLSESADNIHGCYAAGGYATRNFSGLQENYYFGIRRYPYSTNTSKNPLTFKDIDPAQASSHSGIPRSSVIPNTANEVHNEGEVWCVALWEMRANLITKHGFAAGNELTLQIVTDAMKLCPANPNFIQSRDAIVQADLVNNSGANRNEIWNAFAKRGMGASAWSPSSGTTSGVVEAFDLPDDLSVSPTADSVIIGEAGGPFDPASISFTLSNNGASALDWTASVDQSWLSLDSDTGTIPGGGTATVSAAPTAAANSLPNGLHTAAIVFTNTGTGMAFTRNVKLRVGFIDYFTELFSSSGPHDIDNQSFTFTPDTSASGYTVVRTSATSFPTSTTGGTSLSMTDDTFAQVTLTGGAQVILYGVSYSSFYVGSNGFVTFGSGDISWEESLDAHFDRPRISALFDDLFPTGSKVTWKQTSDRVAVSWNAVREYGTNNSNSLQIEMFFDGRIRITHLAIAATDGLIGLSAGGGVPVDFIESDFSAYTGTALAVSLPVSATEGDGVLTAQGTVTRSVASSSALTVALTSNDSTELTVPASVTIEANQASATFDLIIIEDTLLDGSQLATVAASASGATSGSGSMTIHDNETTTLTLILPASVTEGDTGLQGTVTLALAADSPVTVSLSSSDAGNLALPPTVMIATGEVSASFPVTVIDDNLIDGTQTVTGTAHVEGWTDGTAMVQVLDNEAKNLAIMLPSMIEGDTETMGTVAVSGTLIADLVVTLESSDLSELVVPETATIPAGQSSATFPLTLVDDPDVDGAQSVQVSASAAGFTTGVGSGVVLDNELASLAIGAVDPVRIRNAPFALTITAFDVDGNVLANFAGPVSLSASGDEGSVAMTPATASPFVSGQWTGNVAMLNYGIGVRITATAGAITAVSSPFTVTHGAMDRFAFDPLSAVQYKDLPFAVAVRARDAFGNDVSSFSGSANLSTSAGGTQSEVTIGTGGNLANVPFSTGSEDCRAQMILTAAELGGADYLTSLALDVGSLPGQTMTRWTIRFKHTAMPDFGADPSWQSTGWTTVYQADETISATGWVAFPFSAPFAYNGTDNLMIDFSFDNTTRSFNGTVRYTSVGSQRTVYATAESTAGDPLFWSGATPTATASFSIFNVRIGKGMPAVPVNPGVAGPFVNGVWSGNVTIASAHPWLSLIGDDGAFHSGSSNFFEILPAQFALDPEPPFTGGTTNMISWQPMGAGIEFEVERSTDGAFTAPLSSGWLPAGAVSHEFTGLADSTAFWYRARMRRPGSWESSWTAPVTSTQDASPPQVAADPSSIFTIQSSLAVQGTAADLSGIAFVRINGADAATSDSFAHWSKALPGLAPGENTFAITAGDLAVPPNTTSGSFLVFLIADPSADGDHDGIQELLEHAFNLDPEIADLSALPPATVQTDPMDGKRYLTLQYRRRIDPAGFRYLVQTSADLRTWADAGADVTETGSAATGDGVTETVTVRVLPDVSSASFKFVRLKVEID